MPDDALDPKRTTCTICRRATQSETDSALITDSYIESLLDALRRRSDVVSVHICAGVTPGNVNLAIDMTQGNRFVATGSIGDCIVALAFEIRPQEAEQ